VKLANTTMTATTVAAGAFTVAAGQLGQQPIDVKALPAFCRVRGVMAPTADSRIEFEVWLPAAGWNGKYRGLGNGGFAGAIDYGSLANSLAFGYAASATDTGHKGTATDASWALGHPEKVADFGYRAIHETAENTKELVKAYYSNGPRRSYFSSCSNGGREALMEAQRYPADYDGILAGAPANYWTHLLTAAAADVETLNEPGAYIPAAKLPAIQAATVAACDARDGVKDGVIDDPARCQFDPAQLLCKDADSNDCLTAPQVTALKKLYTGARDAAGKQIFPGRVVGGETGLNAWADWITGREPNRSLMYAFSTQFFGNMVYENASWDYHTFQADRAAKTADDKLARTLNATDADLKRFRDRGGRLIMYHGWSDAAISPLNSIDYFQAVEAKMGAKDTAKFLRLYLAPGMTHCAGGPGPDSFGQAVDRADAQHSVTKALEQWVEDGTAPQGIVATKYKAGPASEVVRTRPLCPYPQVARYKGSGNTDDAANFTCVTAK
jgi:feruloyl esterase